MSGWLRLGGFLAKRSTPMERLVIVWLVIVLCLGTGGVCLYFAFTASPAKAAEAAELRLYGWGFLGAAFGWWAVDAERPARLAGPICHGDYNRGVANDWIDISVPLRPELVAWPDDPGFSSKRNADMGKGDVCNLTAVNMCAHTGTHMDAPLHFVADGLPMDALPFDAVVGPARVIEIADPESIKPHELEPHDIQRGERILFKTRNSSHDWSSEPFDEGFVHISVEAAQYLVDRGVQTVGVDYLSIGGFKKGGVECHQIILGAGVWVIEGLDLREVSAGEYDLICLPLRLQGAEGAPARVIVRRR